MAKIIDYTKWSKCFLNIIYCDYYLIFKKLYLITQIYKIEVCI